MSLSKFYPQNILYYLWEGYSTHLGRNPLIVKSITSGVLSAWGNILAQTLGKKSLEWYESPPQLNKRIRTVFSFFLFGLSVTGPLSHFFLNWLEKHGPSNWLLKLLFDRLAYGSFFLLISLYLLSIFEGLGHSKALENIKKVYWSAFQVNLKVWTLAQLINLNFVPIKYRVLVLNLVSIFWNIYLSQKRAREQSKPGKD